jgi:hypothetical protein
MLAWDKVKLKRKQTQPGFQGNQGLSRSDGQIRALFGLVSQQKYTNEQISIDRSYN